MIPMASRCRREKNSGNCLRRPMEKIRWNVQTAGTLWSLNPFGIRSTVLFWMWHAMMNTLTRDEKLWTPMILKKMIFPLADQVNGIRTIVVPANAGCGFRKLIFIFCDWGRVSNNRRLFHQGEPTERVKRKLRRKDVVDLKTRAEAPNFFQPLMNIYPPMAWLTSHPPSFALRRGKRTKRMFQRSEYRTLKRCIEIYDIPHGAPIRSAMHCSLKVLQESSKDDEECSVSES